MNAIEELLKKIKERLTVGCLGEVKWLSSTPKKVIGHIAYSAAMKYIDQALALSRAECEWKWDDVHDKWDTSCGQAYCTEGGSTLEESCVGFCPFKGCGKRIIEKKA